MFGTITAAGILSFLSPFAKILFENCVKEIINTIKDKKAAKAEARKLLYNVYLEVTNNLGIFDGYIYDKKKNKIRTRFTGWKINGLECKEFSGKLKIQFMDTLLSHIAFSFGMKKIQGSEAYDAILKTVSYTKKLIELSKSSNKLIKDRTNIRTSVKLGNIYKKNLIVYNGLFKVERKK